MTTIARLIEDPARGSVAVASRLRSTHGLAGFSANRPSFYADPLAWLVTAAIDDILRGLSAQSAVDPGEVGVVVVSSARSLPTAGLIAQSTARGRISPLRFAGGNPGILAGLACIQHGFRGPSMVLTAADAEDLDTVDAALALASSWLISGHARSVFCVRHIQVPNSAVHTVAAVLLRGRQDSDLEHPATDPRESLVAAAAHRPGPATVTGAV
jgi:3-oxoacyl-(acyl-carrier-protein) synthase